MSARIQEAINQLSGCLTVDGKIGSKTIARFKSLSESKQEQLLDKIPEAATELGIEDEDWFPEDEAIKIADKVSSLYELDPKFMRMLLEIEPEKKEMGGEVYLNLHSRSPSGDHFGITQVGRPAWKDAKRFDREGALQGRGYPSLVDPRIAIHAAAAFAKANLKYLRDDLGDSFEVTPDLLYVAHNQGWGGAKRALQGDTRVEGDQSHAASAAIQRVRKNA